MRQPAVFLEFMIVEHASNSPTVRGEKFRRHALAVISQVVALAPFSQNSNGCGLAGLAQAQLTQAKPSGLFWCIKIRVPLSGTRSRVRLRVREWTEPQPPAGWV